MWSPVRPMPLLMAEGAGAAALAALLQERQAGKRVAVVLSGANVDRERYAQVLAGTEKS